MFLASTVSNVGDGVIQVAFPLYVAHLTRNELLVAAIAFAQQLPWTLAAPFAGVAADRFDRRRLMITADVARVVVLSGFALAVALGSDSLALAYAVAFVLGAMESVFDVTAGTMVPSLVTPDQLDIANGRLFASELVAENFAAPPLGALLFGLALAAPFAADATTFAVSAIVLAGMRGAFLAQRTHIPGHRVATAWREARQGFERLWREVRLRGLAIVSASIGAAEWALLAVLVLFALDELGTSRMGYALLFAVATIGAFGGSVAAARLGQGGAERMFVLSTALHGVLAIVVATAPSVTVAALALAAWGFAIGVSNVMYVGIRQRHVPDEWLGRVGGALGLVNGLAGALGALGAGGVARAASDVRLPIALAGAVEMAVAGVIGLWWMRHGLLQPSEPGEPSVEPV
jgi:MFS family permease